MKKFIDKEYDVLKKALTRAEVIRGMDDAGYIEGVISLSLASLIDSDYENFLDLISNNLIGSVCLSDIQYEIVGCSSADKVLLLVSGHADDVSCVNDDIPNNLDVKLSEKFSFKSTQNSFSSEIIYYAERINEHEDYHITWKLKMDEEDANTGSEHYIEAEVKYFIHEGLWIIIQ